MVGYLKLSLTNVFDAGAPVIGAKLFAYDGGTLTPRSVYQDSGLTVPYAQPILTNAAARIPQMFVTGNPVRIRIFRPNDTLLEDIDNLPGDDFATSSGGGGGGGGGGTSIPPGFIMHAARSGPMTGWVRANGRSIGSASSGATERAAADCHDLFVALWTDITSLPVSGGRGANAEADWSANKQLTLPDAMGRALFGVDAMGASAANRLNGATFASGTATAIGSYGGSATVTLSTAQIPSHNHTGSTSSDGSHNHTGTTSTNGQHGHISSTSSNGAHDHTFDVSSFTGGIALSGGGGSNVATGIVSTTTSINGDHSHGVSVTESGDHSHTFTASTVSAHFHTFTTAGTGGGSAHDNTPPFLLTTVYIKL